MLWWREPEFHVGPLVPLKTANVSCLTPLRGTAYLLVLIFIVNRTVFQQMAVES